MRSMYFKRAKIFLHQDSNGGEQRYIASVGGPVQVPNWVCKTLGYKYGIKDGSIVDVTPPKVITPIVEDDAPETTPAVPQDGPPEEPSTNDIADDEEPEEPETEEAPKAKAPKPSRAGKGSIR